LGENRWILLLIFLVGGWFIMIHLDAERYREEKTTFVGEKCWGIG